MFGFERWKQVLPEATAPAAARVYEESLRLLVVKKGRGARVVETATTMRDYNQIQFKSPKQSKVKDHPLVTPVVEEEKKETTPRESESSSATTPPQSSSPQHATTTSLSAADALAVRRDGAEATIMRLREALDTSSANDNTSKTTLAKSDAVILELRSSVRQLKRQLEKVQDEKTQAEEDRRAALERLQHVETNADQSTVHSHDAHIGELQVQLDRAHAQILTADMVRKELEDTLEAEQYTWELRVQDQERTIQEIEQECSTLANDLEQCRSQWKEAEDGWTREVQELQDKLEKVQQEARHWKSMKEGSREAGDLQEKILALEQERSELQGCLDEALKELEAVDAELQGDESAKLREENERLQRLLKERDTDLLEPLQHLYRWLLERDGVENVHTVPKDERQVVAAIRSHLDRMPPNDKDLSGLRKQVEELESQVSVYKGDLKAREESSSELRASLKEAVALLKPLQDAVAKADREKAKLQKQIDELQKQSRNGEELSKLRKQLDSKDDDIDNLKQEIESLEIQLSKAKLFAASSLVTAHKDGGEAQNNDSFSKTREELKAKRKAEKTLKELLQNAQTKFSTLHQQNREVEAMNSELQDRLRSAEEQLGGTSGDSIDYESMMQRNVETRDIALREMDDELKVMKGELSKKEVELRTAHDELEKAKSTVRSLNGGDHSRLHEAQSRVYELEKKLSVTSKELAIKREAEKALNKSLKEALNLLRPLQEHLEDAEEEKKELAREVHALRRKLGEDPSSSRSFDRTDGVDSDTAAYLRDTVKQLEKENSQLHDALEDMSQSLNASHLSGATAMSQKNEGRLREEIVELKSRYEVTQSRLEDAFVENHSLVESLTKREKEEKAMVGELSLLREKLKKTESELEKAKFMATSALAEEAETEGRILDQQAPARGRRSRAPYRLT